ncbi:MAG: hypothetical protein ABIT37_24105 [Luteolibacter sp.]
MPDPVIPPPFSGEPPKAGRPVLAIVLSLMLGFFLLCGVVALVSAAETLLLHRRDLELADGLLTLLLMLTGVLTYCLLGFFPEIPKRWFVPVCLFAPAVPIAILPLLIYFHAYTSWIDLGVAAVHLLLGLWVLRKLRGKASPVWPLVPAEKLVRRKFSWANLAGVALVPVLVLLPVALLYCAFSAKLALEHFTDGFARLHPRGITMQVRDYVRDDGRKITLVPMSHVGETDFYQDVAASFPDDAVVLMEGVSDTEHLLDVHSNYSRMADSVGGVEQVKVFKPRGHLVPADVDMSTFSPASLEMLKTVLMLHAKGVTQETLPYLMKPTPPGLEKELLDDILTKRNHHLLSVIQEWLPQARTIIVPWGAAHMAETAREIQKLGFRQVGTREYTAIRFGS